jgi:hypothetical protein
MDPLNSLRVERTAASAPVHSREASASTDRTADEPGKQKNNRPSTSKLNQALRNLNPFKVRQKCTVLAVSHLQMKRN